MKLSNTILLLGGDGYLGWSIALALANRTDDQIVIVDNLSKRKWEAQVNVQSLVQLKPTEERVACYKALYRRNNLAFENRDLTCYDQVAALISKYNPRVIINTAQQPSAPFSMMSPENARTTFDNNSTTNLNVLWAIGSLNSEINYITLGSAGTYLSIDTDYIPKNKVDLKFAYQDNLYHISDSWLPMQASDIYHQSKINSFLLNDLCTQLWGLKTATVHQSTIFGHTIPENQDPKFHELSTRFNYDHIFGTVMNRFVCQAVIQHPITVYGDGEQKTGVICLADAVDNFVRLCHSPLEKGKHLVEHNYTHKLSINEMASHLSRLTGTEVDHVQNPRLEPDSKRKKVFELPEHNSDRVDDMDHFAQSVSDLHEFVSLYKENINPTYIQPSVHWNIRKTSSTRKAAAPLNFDVKINLANFAKANGLSRAELHS